MKKHTPGPWTVTLVGGDPDESYRIEAAEGQFIAKILGASFDEQRFENASLVAAAPELFEACKLALNYLETQGAFSDGSAYPALLRAIAKAEGRKK